MPKTYGLREITREIAQRKSITPGQEVDPRSLYSIPQIRAFRRRGLRGPFEAFMVGSTTKTMVYIGTRDLTHKALNYREALLAENQERAVFVQLFHTDVLGLGAEAIVRDQRFCNLTDKLAKETQTVYDRDNSYEGKTIFVDFKLPKNPTDEQLKEILTPLKNWIDGLI